jgi:exonuclease SbcC
MIPIKLKLTGFTSYREAVEIDFTGLDLVCISGPNGAGKSSLLDAITYALYGQARKRDEAIINETCDKAEVSLEFGYQQEVYKIVRSITRGKGSQVDFFIRKPEDADGGSSWRTLTERTLSETNAKILRTLGLDYETFINASFFLQGKADLFATQTPSERKKILGNILGLDRWEEYRKRAAEMTREKQGEINQIDARLADIQAELDKEPQYKKELELFRAQAAEAFAKVQNVQSQLEQKRLIEEQLAGRRQLVETYKQQMERLLADQNELQTRVERTQDELAQVNQELAREEEIKAAYDHLVSLRQELAAMDALDEQARPLENRQITLEQQIELARHDLQQEMRVLEQDKVKVEKDYQQNDERINQREALQQQIAVLEAQIALKEALEAEQQNLKDQLAAKQAENAGIEKQGKELRERLERVSAVEGASCPLCGQPLATHDRDRLQTELTQELETLRSTYKANEDMAKELKNKLAELEKQLRQIRDAESRLQTLLRQSDQLTQLIDSAAEQWAKWQQEKAPRLEEIHARLERDEILPDAQAELTKVKDTLQKLGYDRDAHLQLREAVQAAEPAQRAYNHLAIAKNNLAQLQKTLAEQEATLEKKTADLTQAQAEYSQAKAALEQASQGLPSLDITEEDLVSLKEEEAGIRRNLIVVEQLINNLQVQKQRKESLRMEKEALNQDIVHLKKLERAFSKDGVPAMLIEQALPAIQEEANTILSQLSNYTMSVTFDTQRSYKSARREDKMETLDIRVSDGSGTRDYETYSGGEAFRINFAIRLALARVLARRAGAQVRTLVIDEGFGNQDAEGRQRLIEAIGQIRREFDLILVITHLDELKDQFPARIEVDKTLQGSQVNIIQA